MAYEQAEADYFEAHKQIEALEEQTIKYLTGENTMDIDIINSMMPKYREKLQKAKAKIDTDKNSEKDAEQEIADLLSWAEAFDEANNEAKHMIIARLVERIEIGRNYKIEIKFRISIEQYMQIAA